MTEQTTRQFLFSREGRPILLGSLAAVIIFGGIGYYSYNALYGSEPERRVSTAQQKANAGDTRVRATSQPGGATNLTSDGLNPEARAALEEFNNQANQEGRMGQPTPDDVVLIPVEPSDTDDEQQAPPAEKPQFETAGRPERRQEPQLTPEERRQIARMREERQRLMLQEAQEYRSRRFAAANEMIALYATPASMDGMSFSGDAAGRGKYPEAASLQRTGDGSARLDPGDGTGQTGQAGGVCENPLIRGGEIVYAQTDIALNTDFQGPVRMTFLGGNLTNYVGLGAFELNELGAKMELRINTLFDQDGQRYSVSGYVLDPETTLWAMSSDVDYHIIYRYGGFGLGTILSAFSILAENRAQVSQVVTPDGTVATENRDPDSKQVTWTLLGEFSRLFEEAFRDNINRPITVTLDPEEEAGVLFEDTVCKLDTEITREREAREQRMANGLRDPLN